MPAALQTMQSGIAGDLRVRRSGCPLVCRFSDAGMTRLATSSEAGVGKAPRHEIAWGVGTVGAAGLYGDLAAASGWAGLGCIVRPDRSAWKDGCG